MNEKKFMKFAVDIGELMLSSGAETSRVEHTMDIIFNYGNFKADIYATPTGIFTSIDKDGENSYTQIRRIDKLETNFNKLDRANSLSRDFCSGKLTLDEAQLKLEEIKHADEFGVFSNLLAHSATSGFFALVFGAQLSDFILASIAGFCLGVLRFFITSRGLSRFTIPFLGGMFAVGVSFMLHTLTGLGENMSIVTIGSIMPLVPGLAITNGIRDTIEGDLVSGVSRIADAFISAAMIASGVAIVIGIYTSHGGVI